MKVPTVPSPTCSSCTVDEEDSSDAQCARRPAAPSMQYKLVIVIRPELEEMRLAFLSREAMIGDVIKHDLTISTLHCPNLTWRHPSS